MKAPLDDLQFDSVIVGGWPGGLRARPLPVGHPGRRVFLIEARQQQQLLFATFRKAQNHPQG